MSGIFVPKIYQNLIIGFQVTVENVGDVFFETQCMFDSRPHRLLLITNRKTHTPFQITRKSLTLDDLESH